MRLPIPLHLPLLLFLLANAAPSDANLFARGTQSLSRAANRLHHRAAKRSAGLAKDLRRAFSGMYAQELAATTGGSQRVYCVNNANAPSFSGSGNSSSSSGSSGSSNGTSSSSVQSSASASSSVRGSSGTSTKHSSSTTASNPSSTSSATSPWKLTMTYVCSSLLWPRLAISQEGSQLLRSPPPEQCLTRLSNEAPLVT